MENYTLVLLEHSGILHTGALMAQHCTQNHRYLAGLLMMQPYLVWTGVAVDTEDCASTGVDLCVYRLRRWKWSVPWRWRWWWWSACHWCPRLPSQVYTGLLVRRRSWVRLLSHRVVWREDCSWLLVTEVIWIACRWRDLFQMSAVPTQVTSWCLYQEWTGSALPHHLSWQLPALVVFLLTPLHDCVTLSHFLVTNDSWLERQWQWWHGGSELSSHSQLSRASSEVGNGGWAVGQKGKEDVVLPEDLVDGLHHSLRSTIALWVVGATGDMAEIPPICKSTELCWGELGTVASGPML